MKIQSKGFLITSFLLSILIASVCSANAHSSLISSDPSSGQILDQISQEMTLTFNEDLIGIEGQQVNTLQLKYVDSGENTSLEVSIMGSTISGLLPARTYPAGKYELSYRVVSADGHPITGVISFSSSEATTMSRPDQIEVTVPTPESALSYSTKGSPDSRGSQILYGIAAVLTIGIWSMVQRKRRLAIKPSHRNDRRS